ncbi:MAG TPA: TPM domain-containing protein, partial [Bacteroidia bacterium]|nr:TPM domain-containing protein [Bacteroidia bacterium]
MKKSVLVFCILFFTGIFSFAQTAADSSALSSTIRKDTIPVSKGWVSDFENIYTKVQVKTLDSLITVFEKKTSYEIAIITVNGSLTTDSAFDSYILKIANAWGVGKKGKDNGMVIG